MKRRLAILVAALSIGCSDYTIHKVVDKSPDISVTPGEYDFGTLNATDPLVQVTLVVMNIGTETLDISANYLLNNDPRFQLDNSAVGELDPGETIDLNISYDPITFENNSETVVILSNDPDEGVLHIPLLGAADAPVIDITPEIYDFGTVLIGCEDETLVTIENIGNVDLEISQIDYFASLPVDITPSDYELEHGALPWILTPSETLDILISYLPVDLHADGGWLEVTSNDPLRPVVLADQVGIGDYSHFVTDEFEQDGDVGVDILFVVDNSGSMGSNQAQLSNNFDTFINVFSASGVDYHIAFITTDQYDFVGDIITPLTADPVVEAMSQIATIGYHGSPHEKGMDMSWNATMTTGDAAPGSEFLRDEMRFVVIYISDEDDFSTVSPSTMETRLLSLKSSSDLVVAHAVAGDVPGGCSGNGHATAGTDYYDLVTAMGGTFLSICAEDWGTPMEELARDSMAVIQFILSETPIEDTIEVTVDGTIDTGWSYDIVSNSVTLSAAPSDGSKIDISYAVIGECEEEDTGEEE